MNKLKKIFIISIILYSFLISTSCATTGTVNVTSARLREEANTTSNIITNIYKDEKVEILGKDGDWYKVKYGNKEGYLKASLLTEQEKQNDIKEIEKSDEKQNNTSVSTYNSENISSNTDSSKIKTNANTKIRFIPSMMSNEILQVEEGKELTKLAEAGNWIRVTDGIVTGWILKNKISVVESQQQVNTSDFENTSNDNKKENEKETDTEVESKTEENTNNTNKENKPKEESKSSITNVNKKGIINVETAKVREKPESKAKVIGFLDYNDSITITAEEGEWFKFTEKDISGYVHKTLVTVKEENVTSRSLLEERKNENVSETKNTEEIKKVDDTTIDTNTNNNISNSLENAAKSSSVVEYAKQFLGYPYVVGGKNPKTGFDCSGFTRYVFLNYGYSLGATAASQNSIGAEISKENLEPGDLILFYDEAKTKIGHTGIFISNGDFIHAANPTRGVVIDNINTNSYYRERFITARRIVQ